MSTETAVVATPAHGAGPGTAHGHGTGHGTRHGTGHGTGHVPHPLVRVYVWELPVRICHWLIFFSIVVLSVTGIYLGNPFLVAPGEATDRFVMGTMKAVHFYAAIAFTLAVLARIVWMFRGNRFANWDKLVPLREHRWQGLWPTVKFYLFALRKPPGFVGHNPVAGLAYTLIYGLCLVQIVTGLAIWAASAGPGSLLAPFDFLVPLVGGLQVARWIHHVSMWLLIGFFVHHVYSALLMSQVEQNGTMESIFSGYKFVPEEDLHYSGYRFVDRTGRVVRVPKPRLPRLAGERPSRLRLPRLAGFGRRRKAAAEAHLRSAEAPPPGAETLPRSANAPSRSANA